MNEFMNRVVAQNSKSRKKDSRLYTTGKLLNISQICHLLKNILHPEFKH